MAKTFFRRTLILGITFSVGVSLSAIAALSVNRWEVSQQQNQFQKQINNLAISIKRSSERYTDVLIFLSDFYKVNKDRVQRQEFNDFVDRSLKVYPGIQALEWASLVKQENRSIYEKSIRTEGYPTFQITELSNEERLIRAGRRPYYIPITYIAPFDSNEAALGFDLNSDTIRAASINSARDSGKIQATSRIRLVQEKEEQYGFLLILPLYKTVAVPKVLITRRTEFDGVLLGVFRVSDVIEESLQGLNYEIDFILYDRDALQKEQFLGHYDAVSKTVMSVEKDSVSAISKGNKLLCPTSINCTRTLEIGQRQWLINFLPSVDYSLNVSYGTWVTLLIGLSLTGSLILFLSNLQNELVQTKKLNELKQRFFSMASHELRTPLSTIVLTSESLQTNYHIFSDTQKQKNIQRIQLTAQQMSQQITDLLTLSRAEAGKLEFNPQILDLVLFCQQVIDEIQSAISQPIIFTNHSPNIQVFWDKKLIRSLLGNLLANAAKYSSEDTSIQVILSSNREIVTFKICDRGIGIPATDLASISEAFQRGSNVEDIPGTGLGLAIVQTCIDRHRGTWVIDSSEGKGTIVTINLRLCCENEE